MTFDATSDERTSNNQGRLQYRTLSDDEKSIINQIKVMEAEFCRLLDQYQIRLLGQTGPSFGREFAIARTNMEQASMWAVRGVTKG